MATAAEIDAWARAIHLAPCVGAEFAADHDGRLPSSVEELTNWGNSSGRRQGDGSWRCLGTATAPPGGTTPPVGSPAVPGGTNDLMGQITDFMQKNPIVVLAAFGFLLMRQKR